ncbi:hypothetical protein D3C73_1404880 [compost metagenome]
MLSHRFLLLGLFEKTGAGLHFPQRLLMERLQALHHVRSLLRLAFTDASEPALKLLQHFYVGNADLGHVNYPGIRAAVMRARPDRERGRGHWPRSWPTGYSVPGTHLRIAPACCLATTR